MKHTATQAVPLECPPPAVRVVDHYNWAGIFFSFLFAYLWLRLLWKSWKAKPNWHPFPFKPNQIHSAVIDVMQAMARDNVDPPRQLMGIEPHTIDITPQPTDTSPHDFGAAMHAFGFTGKQATQLWDMVKNTPTLEGKVRAAFALNGKKSMKAFKS